MLMNINTHIAEANDAVYNMGLFCSNRLDNPPRVKPRCLSEAVAKRGQRFGTLSQFTELLTLSCPAGHRALNTKKQGAGWPPAFSLCGCSSGRVLESVGVGLFLYPCL